MGSHRRTQATLRVCLLMAGVLLVVFLLRRPGLPAGGKASSAPPASGAPAPARLPQLPRSPGAAVNAIARLSQSQEAMRDMLAQYEEASRYGPATVALYPGMDDAIEPDLAIGVERPALRTRNLRRPAEERVFYRLETDRSRYVGPAPVIVRLSTFRGISRRAAVKSTVSRAEAFRREPGGQRVSLGPLALSESRPGVFEASFVPPAPPEGTEDELLEFDVEWTFAEDSLGRASARTMVLYTSQPPASFSGNVREDMRDGSLTLHVEVDSTREGEAQISGRLFARDEQGREVPVAMAVKTEALKTGRSWVALSFYGLVFRDRGLRGPYTLRGVRGHFLSSTSAGRGAEIGRGPEGYTTRAQDLSAFTQQVWDDPRKQVAVRAIEEEIEHLR